VIVLLSFLILFLGAVSILFLTPDRRFLRFSAFLSPALALVVLWLPLPLPDSFEIVWQPSTLFPSPLTFHATPVAISFAVAFCLLLLLAEWTHLFHTSLSRTARVISFLLAMSGMIDCTASNALAAALMWGWTDFLIFLSILLLSRSAVVGPKGIVSTVSRSINILALNFLGTALILYPVVTRPPVAWSDWGAVWTAQSSDLGAALFLVGVTLRLLVLPTQLSFSQSYTSSARVDILMRILAPAIMMPFLAEAWPSAAFFSAGSLLPFWFALFFAFLLFWTGLQWWVSVSPYARRDLFLLAAPAMAVLGVMQGGSPSRFFLAAGLMVVLGGGMLLFFPGYLSNRRWLAAIPLFLLAAHSGLPYTPLGTVFSGITVGADPTVMTLVLLGLGFWFSALIRTAFEPSEEFSSERKSSIVLFIVSVLLAAVVLAGSVQVPSDSISVSVVLFPTVLLLAAAGLSLIARRFQRAGQNILHFAEGVFRLSWLRSLIGSFGSATLTFGTAVEDLFSGEGAMLWAFGLALLLLIILRGG
jgi:hypothetical protein